MAQFDLSRWANSIHGKALDLDNAFGPQCHDVLLSYVRALGGTISDGHAPGNGYTHNVYLQFGSHRPNLRRYFTKHGGANGIRRGDMIFWSSYVEGGGLPHVAIALDPPTNGKVRTVTQDAGKRVEFRYLGTRGIIGVLRPIQAIKPKPGSSSGGSSKKDHPGKTDLQLAAEVWQGKHGVGDARKKSLGNRYPAVQRLVDQGKGKATTPAPKKDHPNKTDLQLAGEVWAGKHGNGDARKKSLGNRYAAVQKLVDAGQGKKSSAPTTHTVQKNETLSSIAKLYGTTWQQLYRINKLPDPNRIYPGQKLKLR